jgi:hypothetical protein
VHNESSYDIRPLDRKETITYRTRNQLPRRRMLLPILEISDTLSILPKLPRNTTFRLISALSMINIRQLRRIAHEQQRREETLITGPAYLPRFQQNHFFFFWQSPENTHLPCRFMQVPEKTAHSVFSEIL